MDTKQEQHAKSLKQGILIFAIVGGLFGIALLLSPQLPASWKYITQGIHADMSPAKENAETALYKPVEAYEEAVVQAVDVASKSVVSIVISKDLQVYEQCPSSPFSNLPSEVRDLFGFDLDIQSQCPTGDTQRQEVGGGSGFIVSSDGLIITNKHVVADTDADYTVITNDGTKYNAKVLARDPLQDIALMKIDAAGLSVAAIGDSDTLKLGQTAIAIGNSLNEFQNSVSVGVISGLARTISAEGQTIQGVIQTDTAINRGNSGGPLLNLKGEVVGINTAIVLNAENLGFAIPINNAKRDIISVLDTGTIRVPYLGVRYMVVTPELADAETLPVTEGALLRGGEGGSAIVQGSPAAQGGLVAEDIIVAVDGEKVTEGTPLNALIGKKQVGDTVTLDIYRNGKKRTVSVTLEERP